MDHDEWFQVGRSMRAITHVKSLETTTCWLVGWRIPPSLGLPCVTGERTSNCQPQAQPDPREFKIMPRTSTKMELASQASLLGMSTNHWYSVEMLI